MTPFNLGTMEIVVIVVIAILAVGPARVVQVIRSIQRLAGQARNLTGQLMSTLQDEVGPVDDITSTAKDAVQALQDLRKGVSGTLTGSVEGTTTDADSAIGALKSAAQETKKALTGVKDDLTQASKRIREDPPAKPVDDSEDQPDTEQPGAEQSATEQPRAEEAS